MQKNIVNFAILTTIVVSVWVFVSIYHSFTSTTIPADVATQIVPIAPNFDTAAITQLQKRKFIPTDLSENIVLPTGTQSRSSSGSAQQIQSEDVPIPTQTVIQGTNSAALIQDSF